MVSLVNSHTNATRIGWHLWEIDLRFTPGLPPGWIRISSGRERIFIELRRRTVNVRRLERARNEGTTGPKRLDDTRCTTYKRRINYRTEALTSRVCIMKTIMKFKMINVCRFRLPGKGNSNSHGARPFHLIITMIKWIRTSRLSIKNSLSADSGKTVTNVTCAPRENEFIPFCSPSKCGRVGTNSAHIRQSRHI